MPTLKLDIVVIPTYDKKLLTILDVSTYVTQPVNPTIEICIPGWDTAILPFTDSTYNTFNSTTLGITTEGNEQDLFDGIYYLKYSIDPAFENYVEKSILRVDKLQEKFDEAFMKLDMMECDRAIKQQSKVDLNTIYLLIQGSIAAANNCSSIESLKLYNKANSLLDHFLKNNCGCSGNNYVLNY